MFGLLCGRVFCGLRGVVLLDIFWRWGGRFSLCFSVGVIGVYLGLIYLVKSVGISFVSLVSYSYIAFCLIRSGLCCLALVGVCGIVGLRLFICSLSCSDFGQLCCNLLAGSFFLFVE